MRSINFGSLGGTVNKMKQITHLFTICRTDSKTSAQGPTDATARKDKTLPKGDQERLTLNTALHSQKVV